VGPKAGSNQALLVILSGQDCEDNILRGLDHWVADAGNDYLAWDTIHFQKS